MKTLFIHDQTTDIKIECSAKDAPMYHHTNGLSFTASGYGRRIPTRYMIHYMGKWRRVYCRIYSNIGTCYIGKLSAHGKNLIVQGY